MSAESHFPLSDAVHKGDIDLVRALLEAGATDQLEVANTFGFTPLLSTAYSNQVDIARLLIAYGANPEARDIRNDITPLMAAAYLGNEELVGLLLEAGADVNARDRNGTTPLIFGACSRNINVAKSLLRCGADRAAIDEMVNLAGDFAAEKEYNGIAAFLQHVLDNPQA